MLPHPRHYLMRVTRLGPLVPAMLWFCDHDPADAANKLDRGRLSVYPRAAIAGEEVDPELLLSDRLMSHTDFRPAHPPTHWRYVQPVSEAVYQHHFERLRWAEVNRPDAPALKPRKAVDARQMPLPDFSRENAI